MTPAENEAVLAFAVALAAAIGGGQVRAATKADEAAIRAAREQSNRAIAQRDLESSRARSPRTS
jgi:hypothetical protein